MTIQDTLIALGKAARSASRPLAAASTAQKNQCLLHLASLIESSRDALKVANEMDLQTARAQGQDPAFVDRLALSDKAISGMAEGLRQVAALPDPVGALGPMRQQPSGILVGHMRVPIGVIGIIYESRPNVTIDAAALCLKSGNATVLRGGSEAHHSNQFLAGLIANALEAHGLPSACVQVVPTTDRAAVGAMITMPEFIDVIIPRGGKSLISRITAEATVPVIKHLDGICHVYIHEQADLEKAIRVADNAKTQRYAPCNAMETLLVDHRIAPKVLPLI